MNTARSQINRDRLEIPVTVLSGPAFGSSVSAESAESRMDAHNFGCYSKATQPSENEGPIVKHPPTYPMLHALSRCTCLVPQLKRTFGTPRTLPPQPICQFVSRPYSQALSPSYFSKARREWSRNNQLILLVGRLLKQEKHEEALEFFKSRISWIPSEHRISRFSVYERGIRTFLNHKRYKDALGLHKQMFAEKIFSSSDLRAKMLVCSDIVEESHEQEERASLFDKLSHVISLPSYSERNLRELLDVMGSLPRVDSQFVGKLVDVYVDSRGSEYELDLKTINKLILFYAHVGSIDTAETLVLSHRDSSDGRPRHANAGPYTTLISELTNRNSLSSRHIDFLLDETKQSQISVDLPLLNALVQSAVRQGDFHRAFALYEMILTDPASHMIPDSFAFGSLFNALQHMWTPRRPTVSCARQPSNAPSPYQLFRQMLECYVLAAQAGDPRTHPVVRVSTLNVALRLFMLSMDYAGAFVTLQTFHGLGLKPDVRSYRFVLTILLAHVKHGLQAEQSGQHRATWAINFLGGERAMGIQPEDVRSELACALLKFAVGETGYRAPGLAVILGDDQAPKNAEWDVEPLERLVARAILATMEPKAVNEGQTERAIREKLVPYFYKMIPHRLWRGRRLRWATG